MKRLGRGLLVLGALLVLAELGLRVTGAVYLRRLHPEPPPPGMAPSCNEAGVLGVLPGVIGVIQATEAVKLLLNLGKSLVGRLLQYDALTMRFREFKLPRDPKCVVCSEPGKKIELIDYEAFCGIASGEAGATRLPVISVEALADARRVGDAPELLDVRERHEAGIVRIPGSRLMPLSELPARLHELDSARPYAIACHQGLRSIEAWYLLYKAGFRHLQVLEGGVDAWAERIDPTLPRY